MTKNQIHFRKSMSALEEAEASDHPEHAHSDSHTSPRAASKSDEKVTTADRPLEGQHRRRPASIRKVVAWRDSQVDDLHPQAYLQNSSPEEPQPQLSKPNPEFSTEPVRPRGQCKYSITNQNAAVHAEIFAKLFCKFLTENPTVFHAVDAFAKELSSHGFEKLSERDAWKLNKGGKYYMVRNGSSMIAFTVGGNYEPKNGAAIIAGHVDALTAKLKPIPKLRTKAGYVQLGVAPYGGALNSTWWDRDLGIGGRVLVREKSGKIVTKLVKLGWPIARIPTLAPHFGEAAQGPFNKETQMVPIIGLDDSEGGFMNERKDEWQASVLGGEGSFASTQPPRLLKAIASELGISDYSAIVNWELELYDSQPAQLGGLDKQFIFAGRIDDKLCSFSAMQALLSSSLNSCSIPYSGILRIVGLFDDEEIGSLLRQGAQSNLLPSTIERIVDSFAQPATSSLMSQTYANSFLVSADVTHAVNPNFLNAYLENHAPRLNTGVAISANSSGHMTTDAVSTALLQRVAEKCGATLQVFQSRNDTRSGGTVGPMLSSAMGMRAVDAGLPQLSMHSIRATTGTLDPGLGVQLFRGFLDYYEDVDKEFRD